MSELWPPDNLEPQADPNLGSEWCPTVEFDPQAESLRCDPISFAALVELADAPSPRADFVPDGLQERALAELRANGVFNNDCETHPKLIDPLGVVRSPEYTIRVTTAGEAGIHQHQLWGSESMAVVLAQLDDGSHQLLTTGPSFPAAALARLIRLRPRPRIGDGLSDRLEPAVLDERFMTSVLAQDADKRRGAVQKLASGTSIWGEDWTHALTDQPAWRASNISYRSTASEEAEDEKGIFLLDTPAGMAAGQHGSDGASTLVPVSPTVVWSTLAALLPTSD